MFFTFKYVHFQILVFSNRETPKILHMRISLLAMFSLTKPTKQLRQLNVFCGSGGALSGLKSHSDDVVVLL